MSEEHASNRKNRIQYHIAWCPRFKYPALKGNVQAALQQILENICTKYNYNIKTLEVMPEHIQIFVDVPQTVAPCDVVRTLKSLSAIEMFKAFPVLKTFYAKYGVLWSQKYFIATVGESTKIDVRTYIEELKKSTANL